MTTEEIALKPLDQHDACDDCGKRTDGLMICTYAHDGSTTKLCPDCITNSGFCYGCGHYCAGSNDFYNNYCGNCHDEIDEDDDFDENDDLYEGGRLDDYDNHNDQNDSQNL